MHIFKLARQCWGGYFFLLLIYWLFFALTGVAFDFPKIFTFIMSLGYFCGAYSLGWRGGRRDSKMQVASLKTAFWGGFFGIIFSVISLVIIIIGKVTGMNWGIFGIASDVSRFLHIHFLYYIDNFGNNIAVHITPVALVLILYPLGYFFGTRKFSIIDKYLPIILYKDKDKKDI